MAGFLVLSALAVPLGAAAVSASAAEPERAPSTAIAAAPLLRTYASLAEWRTQTKAAWLKDSAQAYKKYKRKHRKVSLKAYRAKVHTLAKYRRQHPYHPAPAAPPAKTYRWIPLAAAFETTDTALDTPDSYVAAGDLSLPVLDDMYDNLGGSNTESFTQPSSNRWSCTTVVVGTALVGPDYHADAATQTWQFAQASGKIARFSGHVDRSGANTTLQLDGSRFTLNLVLEADGNSIAEAPFGGRAFCAA